MCCCGGKEGGKTALSDPKVGMQLRIDNKKTKIMSCVKFFTYSTLFFCTTHYVLNRV